MTKQHALPLVVGVDGSPDSMQALEWATAAARLRGSRLTVVSVLPEPGAVSPWGVLTVVDGLYEQGLDRARRQLAEQVERVVGADPPYYVEVRVRAGNAAQVLVDAATAEDQLVVGSRGLGGFARLLLGSVSDAVAHHARGPVTVVRGPRPGPVVVGVDGSAASASALLFAVDRAREVGLPLTVVYAWSAFDGSWPRHEAGVVPPLADFERQAADELASYASPAITAEDVVVTTRLVRGGPGSALVEASTTASEVVVGARGRGGFAGVVLGSTSQQLVRHARCTTTVVRSAPPSAA